MAPLLRFDRSFDVTLVSVEASGIYYFQDASVSEFQVYGGGGFSLYVPIAKWEETLVDDDTNRPFGSNDVSDTRTAAGVHGIGGLLYHINPTIALHMEGRVHIAQSKFTLELPTNDAGIQPLTFDVDYTGFIMNVGVSKSF